MAHRPTTEELDRPLTRQDVNELRQRLSRLAPSRVIDEYHQVYEKCRIDGDRIPDGEIHSGTGGDVDSVVARKAEEEDGKELVNALNPVRVHPSERPFRRPLQGAVESGLPLPFLCPTR